MAVIEPVQLSFGWLGYVAVAAVAGVAGAGVMAWLG
jgi:hypothetical protein